MTGGPAPALAGVTPDSGKIALETPGSDLDLLFLTSDCRECKRCWAQAGPTDVIVTPDPATDSRRSVAKLAPVGVTVVMSSEAWHSYGVTKAPWRVRVRGGEIVSSVAVV